MAVHRLHYTQKLKTSMEEAWAFFSDPHNLATITPPSLGFRIIGDVPHEIHAGLLLQYSVRPFPLVRTGWLTEITHVEAKAYFVDEQRMGPYRLWHHEHFFEDAGGGKVVVRDVVNYVMPFGPLGELAHVVWVRNELRKIFSYRKEVLAQRFS